MKIRLVSIRKRVRIKKPQLEKAYHDNAELENDAGQLTQMVKEHIISQKIEKRDVYTCCQDLIQ